MTSGTFRPHRRALLRTGMGLGATLLTGTTGTAQARQATTVTPVDASGAEPFPLTTLLALVPQARMESAPIWTYADFAQQFASVGASQTADGPSILPNDAVTVTLALLGGSNAYDVGISIDGHEETAAFLEAIGFRPMAMKQHLGFGSIPDFISLYRGDFDAEALVQAWEDAGYAPATSTSDVPVWTIGPEGEVDMEHPVQRIVAAEMNNVAIVGDVLLYTNTLATLNALLEHDAAGGPSALDDPLQGPLVHTLPITTASAMGLPPFTGLPANELSQPQIEALQADLDTVRAEVGPMPDVNALVLAVEAGAMITEEDPMLQATPVAGMPEDAGTMMVRMGTDSAEDAEQAAKVLVARAESLLSLQTGDPLRELMVPNAQGVEGTTATVDFTQVRAPHLWYQMILRGDVLLYVPDQLV